MSHSAAKEKSTTSSFYRCKTSHFKMLGLKIGEISSCLCWGNYNFFCNFVKNLNDWAAIFPLKTWDNRENKQRESTNEDGSTMDNDEEF